MNEIFKFLKYLIRKRWLVIINIFIATLIAFYVAFRLTPVQFASSITFFPPYEEKGLMSFIPGMSGIGVTTTSDIVPQQISTIFNSVILRTKLIDELNLKEKYEVNETTNPIGLALKKLNKNIFIDVEEIGSLAMTSPIGYTISFYHSDKDTAYLGIQYAYHLIDSTIQDISMSHGRRKREFIKSHLDDAQLKYDSIKVEFADFQLLNKAYNIPSQVEFTIKKYAELSGQLTFLELKRSKLSSEYSRSHSKVISVNREIALLKSKLEKMETEKTPKVLGGLNNTISLMPKYMEFTRDIEFYNKMILLMFQQYEEALLKESNDLSALEIIDPAVVPIYKARPKRVIVLAMTFLKYMVLFSAILTSHYFIKFYLPKISWLNELIREFKKK